jgi:hypothetical protein
MSVEVKVRFIHMSNEACSDILETSFDRVCTGVGFFLWSVSISSRINRRMCHGPTKNTAMSSLTPEAHPAATVLNHDLFNNPHLSLRDRVASTAPLCGDNG